MTYFQRVLSSIKLSPSAVSRRTPLAPRSRPYHWKHDSQVPMTPFTSTYQMRVSTLQFLKTQFESMYKLYCLGRKMSAGSFIGLSFIIGSTACCPYLACAMDGTYELEEDHNLNYRNDVSRYFDDDPESFPERLKKIWQPVLLALTVLMSWEYPLTLAVKLLLFLFCTKPSPSSVYLYLEHIEAIAEDCA